MQNLPGPGIEPTALTAGLSTAGPREAQEVSDFILFLLV